MTGRVDVKIPYVARAFQIKIHRALERARFVCAVVNRQAGKTECALQECVMRVLTTRQADPRVGYIAPTYRQGKDIAWTRLKEICRRVPGVAFNESELRIDFPNNGRIRIAGSENPDALRGSYWDFVVLDEVAQMPPPTWPEVIRPALAARRGSALFIGTPAGIDTFHQLFAQAAAGTDPEWVALRFTYWESQWPTGEEIESARRTMSTAQFAREYECSFTAAIEGAYYAHELDEAESQGRITRVPADPRYRVVTSWDLGIGDATAIWLAQPIGNEVRMIGYLEARGRKLAWYFGELDKRQHRFGRHFAPHDAAARELISGNSREEVAASLGYPMTVLPPIRVEDQIEAVRMLIPRCVFDAEACAEGLRALRHYREDRTVRTGEFRRHPLHDWASHGASSFAYLAAGLERHRDFEQPHTWGTPEVDRYQDMAEL